jgi:glycosyltransferase involved in cell wall biosynthesis
LDSSPITISLIFPVFNEASIIAEYLSKIPMRSDLEVIIVDGQSGDETVALCEKIKLEFKPKIVISPLKGRANQLNFGASLAMGEILCFLHLDSQLPLDYFTQIEELLSRPQAIAGAFSLAIDAPQIPFRWLEKLVNWRSHFFSLPYGDQGLFLKTSVFKMMGGFVPMPIMEDYEFVQRLKKQGTIHISQASILTSSRRWQKLGILKTTLINQGMILGYYLKIDPENLARWYRNQK